MKVSNILKPLHTTLVPKDMKQQLLERKTYEYNQRAKNFVSHSSLQSHQIIHTGEGEKKPGMPAGRGKGWEVLECWLCVTLCALILDA